MKILFVASEMAPFAKTGGLADVIASLPYALAIRGHEVRVIIPLYRSVRNSGTKLKLLPLPIDAWIGGRKVWSGVRATLFKEKVPVYFIEHNEFYDREGIYHDNNMNDYGDNPLRYAFLVKAALKLCFALPYQPDVIHIHDWQTSMLPAVVKMANVHNSFFRKCGILLTIHNMAYQGVYSRQHFIDMGIDWSFFRTSIYESFGGLNLLKGGIVLSDMVNTVSPSYADEVRQTLGFGLETVLRRKGSRFVGVLNGVDYDIWSPENDRFIPASFSRNDMSGKRVCKVQLQKLFGLDEDTHIAIIGIISRLVAQKGLDLVESVINSVLKNMHVQFVILGSGDKTLEKFFMNLPHYFPGRVGSYIGFNEELAHLIEAGADFFLMPSKFEPCGLNQLYSMRYGTLPIVHATGGLDDSVENYNEVTGEGTGFKCYDYSGEALYYTIGWAISTYYDRPEHLKKLQRTAMSKDFSWKRTAGAYEVLYKAVKKK